MANDYKKDESKPPVMDAIFIPYRHTLLALAAMMDDMRVKHQLQGASNPFEEWRQLPDAKKRLANAGARHALQPWAHNTKDALPGTKGHLHILHAIWGLMSAYEKHAEEQHCTRLTPPADLAHVLERARADLDMCECGHTREHHLTGIDAGWSACPVRISFGQVCGCKTFRKKAEPTQGHYWTGDSSTWFCTCGAGRPDACTCNRSNGDHC